MKITLCRLDTTLAYCPVMFRVYAEPREPYHLTSEKGSKPREGEVQVCPGYTHHSEGVAVPKEKIAACKYREEVEVAPVNERDCDTCQHDGGCYDPVIKCKGYAPLKAGDIT